MSKTPFNSLGSRRNLMITSILVITVASFLLPIVRRGIASPAATSTLTVAPKTRIDIRRCLSGQVSPSSRILDFDISGDEGIFLVGDRSSRWLVRTDLHGACLAGSEIQPKANRIASVRMGQVVLETYRKGSDGTMRPVLLRFTVLPTKFVSQGEVVGKESLTRLHSSGDGWVGIEPRVRELRRARDSNGELVEDEEYRPKLVLDVLPQYLLAPTSNSGIYVVEEGKLHATFVAESGEILSSFPLEAPEITEALSKIPSDRRPGRPDPKGANLFESVIVLAAATRTGNLLVAPSRFDPKTGMKVLEFEKASGRHIQTFLLAPPTELGELRPGTARMAVAQDRLWLIDHSGSACAFPIRQQSRPEL